MLHLLFAVLVMGGCSAPSFGERGKGGERMPSVLRLREEQPGVVGVTATLWAIEDGRLRRQRLVNDRVVSEETRELSAEEVERVKAAVGDASLATLPATSARPVEANVGKLVLEADGRRWETAVRKGAPRPEPATAGSAEARVRAVADAIRALSESKP
jgi:hypothetical protein